MDGGRELCTSLCVERGRQERSPYVKPDTPRCTIRTAQPAVLDQHSTTAEAEGAVRSMPGEFHCVHNNRAARGERKHKKRQHTWDETLRPTRGSEEAPPSAATQARQQSFGLSRRPSAKWPERQVAHRIAAAPGPRPLVGSRQERRTLRCFQH